MLSPTVSTVVVEPLADCAWLLRRHGGADPAASAWARTTAAALRRLELHAVVDVVSAFDTVVVHLDPSRLPSAGRGPALEGLAAELLRLAHDCVDTTPSTARACTLPVQYGGTAGPDLAAVAAALGLSEEDVVDRHCAPTYRVAFLGFLPGFPYLEGLDPSLVLPRRASPRSRVAAGSVAIAANQAGIYPSCSPGGWHLLGRIDPGLALFDPRRDPPNLLAAGDLVRFEPQSR